MKETSIFAAGCFWGVEEAFRKINGVIETEVGYTGGHAQNPTYEEVCANKTGHAEAIQITYDSEKISYAKLLELFFGLHDPTQINRQGPDFGSQYRSAIFYLNQKQKKEAEEMKQKLNKSGKYSEPIATEITKATEFFKAEEYHQKYIKKTGRNVCWSN